MDAKESCELVGRHTFHEGQCLVCGATETDQPAPEPLPPLPTPVDPFTELAKKVANQEKALSHLITWVQPVIGDDGVKQLLDMLHEQ